MASLLCLENHLAVLAHYNNAIHHPNEWHNSITIGDVGFDVLYRVDFPTTATQSINKEIDDFLAHVKTCSKLNSDDFHALMICAMAASYDSKTNISDSSGIRLPFDLNTCQIDEATGKHWLKFDPLYSVKQNYDSKNWIYCILIAATKINTASNTAVVF